jgi:hypothetical protein
MGQTAYPQSYPMTTMTVGQLVERLQGLDPAAQVIFRSPHHGCFGPNEAYTVEAVEAVTMPREELHHPGGVSTDEEIGEEMTYEAHTQVWDEWRGVVIS